jgi:hypothetical protein
VSVPAVRVAEAHERYERLRRSGGPKDLNLPALTRRWWQVVPEATIAMTDVATALGGCGIAKEGWLRCQRALVLVEMPIQIPTDDPIFEGELLMVDGSTLLLRPDGCGQMRVLRHRDAPEAFPGGEPVLAHEVVHVATPAARGIARLRYRVYLSIDAEQGAVPRAYRFIGFEPIQAGVR